MVETLHTQSQSQALSMATRLCSHSRIIDDVLTPTGLKTGKVRCIECCAVFDDPAPVQRSDSIQKGILR
jgi:hypothetical protein